MFVCLFVFVWLVLFNFVLCFDTPQSCYGRHMYPCSFTKPCQIAADTSAFELSTFFIDIYCTVTRCDPPVIKPMRAFQIFNMEKLVYLITFPTSNHSHAPLVINCIYCNCQVLVISTFSDNCDDNRTRTAHKTISMPGQVKKLQYTEYESCFVLFWSSGVICGFMWFTHLRASIH